MVRTLAQDYNEGVFMRQVFVITRVFSFCRSQDLALLYGELFYPDGRESLKNIWEKLVSLFKTLAKNVDTSH
jgi:hypothetical protein